MIDLNFRWVPVLIIWSLFGCQNQSGKAPENAVAMVNSEPITASEFEKKAAVAAHVPGKDFSSLSEKKDLLKEIVREELLFQAGMADKIAYNSERLKREIAREYLTSKISKDRHEPTQEEIQKYYQDHLNELERVRASHILIKPENPKKEESWEKAKTQIEKIQKEFEAKPTKDNFAALARKYSQDESNKGRGGDLFFFDRKRMVPEFSDAAFSLKEIGDVSKPVKTQFGYHLIMLTGEQRGIEFFKSTIRWRLVQEKQKEKADLLFKRLAENAKIKTFDDRLASVEIKNIREMPGMHKIDENKAPAENVTPKRTEK